VSTARDAICSAASSSGSQSRAGGDRYAELRNQLTDLEVQRRTTWVRDALGERADGWPTPKLGPSSPDTRGTVVGPEGFAAHGPFDVILELVGAPNLADDLVALGTLGRIAVIGIGADIEAEINLALVMGKRARLMGSTLRPRTLEEKASTARAMERSVLPLFASGVLKVPIASAYPLEEATAAYDRFAAGGKLGKIVLTM
jgi:threonine dehydrogenase-like Zn-dependent dehydrogenase